MELKQQDVNNKKIFENMKTSYAKKTMPEDAVNKMKNHIAFAKVMNRRQRQKKMVKAGLGMVAGMAILLFALPNTSPRVANAMAQVPGLKGVVQVATACGQTGVKKEPVEEKETEVAEVEALKGSVSMAQDTPEAPPEDEAAEDNAAEAKMTAGEEQQKPSEEKKRLSDVEITKIADHILAEFKASIRDTEGYGDVMIRYDVMDTTDEYFTMKIDCYQSGASGVEWAYYRTVSMETGKIITLKQLFDPEKDYVKVISDNIKEQMRAQMEKDDSVSYWIDSEEEFADWDFESISENTEFYINKEGEIVICFDEGEVAPMCMGMVTFTIPKEITEPLQK